MVAIKQFAIELERQDAVYYAGEVVKGTVVVDLPQDVKCRGLRLRLFGHARAHWHTGGGDHRTDYDGLKTFQDHRITLFGNFFNSDVIDEGGSDPTFGIAMGEGIIYVPCEEPSGPKALIVRVMDYDWGKRDDLLGEMLLDAQQLVASHTQQTFQLSRKGSMNSGAGGATAEITLSASVMPLSALLPSVSSSQVAKYCLVLEAHRCGNLRKADWVGHNDVYVQAYFPSSEEDVQLRPGKALPKPEKRTVIPAGRHKFPFVMPLRADAPGSAELGVYDRSYIRYELRANIDLAAWADPTSRRAITVLPSMPMPAPQSLVPAVCHRLGEDMHSCSCCGFHCCKVGSVSVSLAVGRQAYAIGERIDLQLAKVVNASKKPVKAELVLVQYVQLMQTGRVYSGRTTGATKNIAVLASTVVPPEQTVDKVCDSDPTMPPAPPSFFGALGRVWGGEPLTWTYALELQTKPESSSFGSTVSASVPVLIPAAAPYPSSLPSPAAPPTDVSSDLAWSVQAKAVLDSRACTTGPLLSGSEDVQGVANLVAAGVPVCIATEREKKHIDDLGQLDFQPFELQWPESLEQWPAASTGDAGGQADTGGGFEQLEDSLRSCLDRRTAVGNWVRMSPGAASQLTPEQMGRVLAGTTLSLEQPAVARELALGLQPAHRLTCAHMLAAVEACPFAKTDVALVLAPLVSDPGNREPVLALLYSFDRPRIEELMLRAVK